MWRILVDTEDDSVFPRVAEKSEYVRREFSDLLVKLENDPRSPDLGASELKDDGAPGRMTVGFDDAVLMYQVFEETGSVRLLLVTFLADFFG